MTINTCERCGNVWRTVMNFADRLVVIDCLELRASELEKRLDQAKWNRNDLLRTHTEDELETVQRVLETMKEATS